MSLSDFLSYIKLDHINLIYVSKNKLLSKETIILVDMSYTK